MEAWAAIDLLRGKVVTLEQGDASRRTVWAEEPMDLAARWEDDGADGLHIVDLDAAFGTGSNQIIVDAIVRRAKIPVQVGGGVRSEAHAKRLLDAGVARVILGTLAYKNPRALEKVLDKFGSEKVVVATDYKNGRVVSGGWKNNESITVLRAVRNFEAAGVKNILATAVGHDGLGKGPDVAMVRKICAATEMKVLASGGIRSKKDVEALGTAGAQGVVLGRALYEETIKLRKVER
jgi:phosphoribosylformimino-5-aminoimidazole carboxamide ribotide isomerase